MMGVNAKKMSWKKWVEISPVRPDITTELAEYFDWIEKGETERARSMQNVDWLTLLIVSQCENTEKSGTETPKN